MSAAAATVEIADGTAPLSRGSFRLEIACPIEFLGPIHVGTGERLSIVSDAPVLRDTRGRPYLPGSSIRGVLRDWCEREAPLLGVGPGAVRRLFGATPTAAEAEAMERNRKAGKNPDPLRLGDRQGRLTVFDCKLVEPYSEVRDHVKIDRRWGAAAFGAKFDQEIVHCKRAVIRLCYEGDGSSDEEVVLLRDVVSALENGLLAFGGKTGWGLGWAVGQRGRDDAGTFATAVHETRRSDACELSEYLLRRLRSGASPAFTGDWPVCAKLSPIAVDPAAVTRGSKAWSWLRLDAVLQFDGPMLVAGPDRDPVPAKERSPDAVYLANVDGNVVLPGSSWRGALHSHIDRIATTLQCVEVAGSLFGTMKGDDEGCQGALRVGDGKLVDACGKPLTPQEARTIWMDHVAIDRVTGFAADLKLFNCRALASPRFAVPLLVRWHDDDALRRAAAALFLLALRDAERGLLWVGSRTTRGYGYLSELRLTGGQLGLVEQGARRRVELGSDSCVATLAAKDGSADDDRLAVQAALADLITAWQKAYAGKGATAGGAQ